MEVAVIVLVQELVLRYLYLDESGATSRPDAIRHSSGRPHTQGYSGIRVCPLAAGGGRGGGGGGRDATGALKTKLGIVVDIYLH